MVKNKRAAMELTMGTMVTIVLVVAALILGLVLVQKIFTGATESVDEINLKVMGEIGKLFADEDSSVIVKLGGNKARIKVGTRDFGFVLVAIEPDGMELDAKEVTYKLWLKEGANNCKQILGEPETEALITDGLGPLEFDQSDGGAFSAVRIGLSVPKGTPLCTQKVGIEVWNGADSMGTNYFVFEIIKSGIF